MMTGYIEAPYLDGITAAAGGACREANPYAFDCSQQFEWDKGWLAFDVYRFRRQLRLFG